MANKDVFDVAMRKPEDLPLDLRIEMRAKNNILWKAIFAKYPTLMAFCCAHEKIGKRAYVSVSFLMNLKISPFLKRGDGKQYREICLKVAKALESTPENLFPSKLYWMFVGKETTRSIEVSSFTALPAPGRKELLLLSAPEQTLCAGVERQELAQRLQKVMRTLYSREREVIKLRYGLDGSREHTLRELASIFNLGPERIRQIEMKALRKLQQPSRSQELLGFLD